MDARAVLRMLVRSDNKEAVLFMDNIYYSSNRDASLERQVSQPSVIQGSPVTSETQFAPQVFFPIRKLRENQ